MAKGQGNFLTQRQRERIQNVLNLGWDIIERYLKSGATDARKAMFIRDLCARQIPNQTHETGSGKTGVMIQIVKDHEPEVVRQTSDVPNRQTKVEPTTT